MSLDDLIIRFRRGASVHTPVVAWVYLWYSTTLANHTQLPSDNCLVDTFRAASTEAPESASPHVWFTLRQL
jgi:hypothetical protein